MFKWRKNNTHTHTQAHHMIRGRCMCWLTGQRLPQKREINILEGRKKTHKFPSHIRLLIVHPPLNDATVPELFTLQRPIKYFVNYVLFICSTQVFVIIVINYRIYFIFPIHAHTHPGKEMTSEYTHRVTATGNYLFTAHENKFVYFMHFLWAGISFWYTICLF